MATNVNIFSQQGPLMAPLTAQERLRRLQETHANQQAVISGVEGIFGPGSTDPNRDLEAEFIGRPGSAGFVGPEVNPFIGPPAPTEAQVASQAALIQNKALLLQDANEAALRNSDLSGIPANLSNTEHIAGGTAPGRAQWLNIKGLASQQPRNLSTMKRRRSHMLNQVISAGTPRPLPGQNLDLMPEQEAWMAAEFERRGNFPNILDNWSNEETLAYLQYGIPPVRGGFQPHKGGIIKGQSGKTVQRSNSTQFWSPSVEPTTIVGDPNSTEPVIIPTGSGGIQYQQMFNEATEDKWQTSEGGKGEWLEMGMDMAVDEVDWMKNYTLPAFMKELFARSIDPETQQRTRWGEILEQEFGVGAPANPQLAGKMIEAFYMAVWKNIYNDFSDKEKQKHEEHYDQYGTHHEDLWATPTGMEVKYSRQLQGLMDSMGDVFEEVSQGKISSHFNKQVIGQGIVNLMYGLGPRYSLIDSEITAMGPESRFPEPRVLELGEKLREGEHPIYGIRFKDRDLKQKLGDMLGILQAQAPGFRKNAITTPIPPMPLNSADPDEPSNISGVSSLFNLSKNMMQNYTNKHDQYYANIVTGLYAVDWNWEQTIQNDLKFKEDQINILNEQMEYIRQRGGVFYNPVGSQASGRQEIINLAGMQHMPVLRIATIPAKPFSMELSMEMDPDNYTKDEKDFIAGAMELLSTKTAWGDGVNQSNDDSKYHFKVRRFRQLLNPKHPMRELAETLTSFSTAWGANPGGVHPNDVGLDREKFEQWIEGKNDIHAVWLLNEFIKAKEYNYEFKGARSTFLYPYLGSVDMTAAGYFGEAVKMGDKDAYISSGGRSAEDESSYFHSDNINKLEVEKVYQSAQALGESLFINRVVGDPELLKFAQIFFGYDPASGDLTNFFQSETIKKGIIGAIYGQGKPASKTTYKRMFTDWLGKVDNANQDYSGFPLEPGERWQPKVFERIEKKYGKGEIFFKPRIDKETGEEHEELRIMFKRGGEVEKQANNLADIMHKGMHKSTPLLKKYVKEMQQAFLLYVDMNRMFGQDLMGGIKMVSIQPDLTNPDAEIYDSEGNFANPVEATTLDFLKWLTPDEYIKIPMMSWDLDEAAGRARGIESGQIFVKDPKSTPYSSLEIEIAAKKWDDPDRPESMGITKWTVFSMHLDEAIAFAIAHVETARKHGLDYLYSVWDEGRMDMLQRENFSYELNKAYLATLRNNNYFESLAKAFNRTITHVEDGGTLTDAKYKEIMGDKDQKRLFRHLIRTVGRLTALAKEIDPKRSVIDRMAMDHGLFNTHAGTERQDLHHIIKKGNIVPGKKQKQARIPKGEQGAGQYAEDEISRLPTGFGADDTNFDRLHFLMGTAAPDKSKKKKPPKRNKKYQS